MVNIKKICQSCDGFGKKIMKYCNYCLGSGVQRKMVQEEISFPKGIDDGTNLKFKGKGHLSGDLVIKVYIAEHTTIKR